MGLKAASALGPPRLSVERQGTFTAGADRHDRQTLPRPDRHVAAKGAGQVPPSTAADAVPATLAAPVALAANAKDMPVAHAAVPTVPCPEGGAGADDQRALPAGAGEASLATTDAAPTARAFDRAEGLLATRPLGPASASHAREGFAEVDDLGPLPAGPVGLPVQATDPALADPPAAGPDGTQPWLPRAAVRPRLEGRTEVAGVAAVPDDPGAALAVLHAGRTVPLEVRAAGPPVAPLGLAAARRREAPPVVDDQGPLAALTLEVAGLGAADPASADPLAVQAEGPVPGPLLGAAAALPAEARALVESLVAVLTPLHWLLL